MAVIEASVEFDYTAQEPDELTLKKGDLITAIRVASGGWWEGTLVRENRRGMFPDNFVKVLGEEAVVMRKKPGRQCRVLFSYTPANADELELHVDDIIDVLSEVEEGWWRGRLRNRTGVFPSNFVEEMEVKEDGQVDVMPPEVPTTPVPSMETKEEEENVTVEVVSGTSTTIPCLPPKPVRERCRVLYPYEAQNEDELSLKEEDIVLLISRDAPDKGWWRGELNGRTGLFPDNFVTILPITEETKSDKASSSNKTTTNKARDSITKSGETTTAALRKSLDLTNKKEEESKPSPVQVTPPVALKQKPAPPIKKPSRSPPSNITPASQVTPVPKLSPGTNMTPTSPKHSMKFTLPIPPPPSTAPDAVTSTTVPVSDSNNRTQISIPSPNPAPDSPGAGDSHDGACISRTGAYSVTNVNCNSQPTVVSAIVNNHHDSITSTSITRRSSNSDSERRTSAGATVNTGVQNSDRTSAGATVNTGAQNSDRTSAGDMVSSAGQSSDRASVGATGAQSSDSELEERPVAGAKLTHLTQNRARAPRRRPPSTVISKEDGQDLSSMLNGSAEAHIIEKISKISPTPAVPWVEELKMMNQVKKNSAQGKTRVTIGPFSSTTTSSSPALSNGTTAPNAGPDTPPSSKSTTVGVMFRSQRPASMFASDPPSQPSTGVALVRNNSTATCNKPPSVGSSPPSIPSVNRPPVSSAISPNAKSSGNEVISITQRQWSDLVDKITRLEGIIESQAVLITELSRKVKTGQDKQSAMQTEMNKLMELVTQV